MLVRGMPGEPSPCGATRARQGFLRAPHTAPRRAPPACLREIRALQRPGRNQEK